MKRVFILLGIVVLAVAAFFAWRMMQPPPDDLDLRTEKRSEQGLYQTSFKPAEEEPAVGPIAVWHFEVTNADGEPVTDAEIVVDGSMPQHGHGLPTVPASTGEISPGVYSIDGMKFSMRGWWEFKLRIKSPAGEDTVTYNTVLE